MDKDVENKKIEKKAKRKIGGIDKKYQRRIFESTKKRNKGVCHLIVSDYDKRKIVQAAFLTVGCRMKRSGSCWNCNYGALGDCFISQEEYVQAFKERIKNISGDTLVLEALGSITDPEEFDQETFKKIFEIAVTEGKFDVIVIETHVTKITEEMVKELKEINQGQKKIFFEIGVEDMNPEHRKLINKIGVENSKIVEIYNLLERYNIKLEMNLIYGFPFMTELERIEAVIESIRQINRSMPNAEATLFLMSIKENTILNYMYQKGLYKKPDPWGFVELTRRILYDEELKEIEPPSYAWFGEKEIEISKEETCYTCSRCQNRIIDSIRRINGTFDNDERRRLLSELIEGCDDGCYEKFLERLENENDGKTPEKRYREFIMQMAKDEYDER